MADPLRYNISSWYQLPECKSNTSVDLYITVRRIIDDGSHRLMGTNIQVQHTQYGTLFACLVNADGTILNHDENSQIIQEFSVDDILSVLATFGFDITFKVNQHLSGDQISYLMTLSDLGFNKIRRLQVYNTADTIQTARILQRRYSEYIVAFNVAKCPDWIDIDYACDIRLFNKAFQNSGAMNLTDLEQTKGFDWTWLTYVADIDDIIRDNSSEEE